MKSWSSVEVLLSKRSKMEQTRNEIQLVLTCFDRTSQATSRQSEKARLHIFTMFCIYALCCAIDVLCQTLFSATCTLRQVFRHFAPLQVRQVLNASLQTWNEMWPLKQSCFSRFAFTVLYFFHFLVFLIYLIFLTARRTVYEPAVDKRVRETSQECPTMVTMRSGSSSPGGVPPRVECRCQLRRPTVSICAS